MKPGERATLAELNRAANCLAYQLGPFAAMDETDRELLLDVLKFCAGHPSRFGEQVAAALTTPASGKKP